MNFTVRVSMLCAGLLACVTAAHAEPVASLGQVEGRVLLSIPTTKKLEPVQSGRPLESGEVLVTGDGSRFEVRPAKGGGLWRVGRRAMFSLKADGARLLAGTALVQVPAKATWRVESARSVTALPEGTWLVQAVDNRGLKIVCLDGRHPVEAWGLPSEPLDKSAAVLSLKPGEVAFLQPGGKAFSPLVTIYLEEVLSTSRLVTGFSAELPGLTRLVNQAIAQRERLTKLSQAVIVGAPKAGGFQVGVPEPAPAPSPGVEKAGEPAKAP